MSRQTEMQELTRIITCSQKLEQIKALLAKGEKRTLDRRRQEWNSIMSMALAQLDISTPPVVQPTLEIGVINETTPQSQ